MENLKPMNWTGYKHYAESGKGYHVSKAGHPPLIIKYLAYTPSGEIIGCLCFCFKDARQICEDHYNEKNKQTEGDVF